MPREQDLPVCGAQHPRNHLERGRLPRAVGAEQAVDLALPHMQAHAVHRRLRVVAASKALGEVLRLQQQTVLRFL